MDHQYTGSIRQASPPLFPNRLSPDHCPASHMMRQFVEHRRRIDQERLHQRQHTSASPTPKPSSRLECVHPTLCAKLRRWCHKATLRTDRLGPARSHCNPKKTKHHVISQLRSLERRIVRGNLTPTRAAHLRSCMKAMRDVVKGRWDDQKVTGRDKQT